jgi:hypothetical protein
MLQSFKPVIEKTIRCTRLLLDLVYIGYLVIWEFKGSSLLFTFSQMINNETVKSHNKSCSQTQFF